MAIERPAELTNPIIYFHAFYFNLTSVTSLTTRVLFRTESSNGLEAGLYSVPLRLLLISHNHLQQDRLDHLRVRTDQHTLTHWFGRV